MSDFWDDAGKILGKVAPILGTAVGGPLGGVAVKAIAGALGLGADATSKDVADAVSGASPDQLLAIKKAEQDFQISLKQLNLTAAQVAAGDRDSARKREAATRDWTPAILMAAVTIGFFTLLDFLAIHAVPAENKDMLNIMLGVLGTAWTGGVTYYFGSSAGSAAKDHTIRTMAGSQS